MTNTAYAWLLFSCVMMPFFPLYGVLARQVFAHTYMGSHRHAFTVGFISLMIMGGVFEVGPNPGWDRRQTDKLAWTPFILINLGCLGRVLLRVITDFVPGVAFPLVGFTGFIEFTALLWWRAELWRTMNLARTSRTKMLAAPFQLGAR